MALTHNLVLSLFQRIWNSRLLGASSDPISFYYNGSGYNVIGCSIMLKKQQCDEGREKRSNRKILDQSSYSGRCNANILRTESLKPDLVQ